MSSAERRDSNAIFRTWCADVTGAVLSIGSGADIDKEGRTYKQYFVNAASYITSDCETRTGCDVVLDARQIGMGSESFNAVFASGVLEHVDDCHAAVSECHRVLKPSGSLIVGVPFQQPIHRAPLDFWRFTEFGVRYLLRAFTIRDLIPIGPPQAPKTYLARAVKS